ncbi:MAG: GGDEF domain-containing protein [Acidaminococcales bacterium]|nr:GGDEF domain-containing protein [Acidaminococcales bacterium]
MTTLLKSIAALLCDVKINEADIGAELLSNPDFFKIYSIIKDLRTLSSSLNKGELDKLVYNKGFILANLKALQSNLRHLTWQTKKISEGDFSQKVDFLGDFSDSFNKMTDKLRENSLYLTELASLDTLTQIPNRRALDAFMDKAFASCPELCVLMADIDFFKKVNDTYGHDIGDELLVHAASLLSKQIRNSDFVARYGGEEFVAILPDTSVEIATKIAERILQVVKNTPLAIPNTDTIITLTLSIGVSCKRPDDSSVQDVLKRSDKALYEAKNNGRDQYRIIS